MITRIFLWLTDGSGNRRRWLFRTLFEIIARLSGHQEHWTFMNYGFADAAKPDRDIDLTPAEEAQRVCCQLYDEVAGAVVIADRDVVEVSCGRGGGAAFVARHKDPRTLTGVDIAPSAIEFCRRVHRLENLRFLQGDAECLPLFDESCDIAINIEASFCYGNFDRFLVEIHRVLRPGGYLLFADLRFDDELPDWFDCLERSGLLLIERVDISKHVLRALDIDGDRREHELRRMAPWFLRGPLRTFGGNHGSRVPVMLASGDMKYYRFVLRKPKRKVAADRSNERRDAQAPPDTAAAQ